MSLRINNNIAAINALRNLNNTTLNLNKSLQRLSSGLRINTAADDPAGLIISEQLRGQISSLQAVSRNISEGTNFFNIGERALEEVNNLLVSMRALAVHAANGATTSDQRIADDQEYLNAAESIQRIFATTRYAGDVIFNGDGAVGTDRNFLIGEDPTGTYDVVSFNFLDWDHVDLGGTSGHRVWGAPQSRLLQAAWAENAISAVDEAMDNVSALRGDIGAMQKNTFETRQRTIAIQIEAITASESGIRDANMAEETTNFTKYQILVQAGTAVLAQANVISQNVLQLLG